DTPNGLVLAGIPADAQVVVAGQEMVKEGEVVKPVPADAALLTRVLNDAATSTD
ncbi:efflux transporter periplasmic adaptor subunit, partial [Salmonella enterica subsp. enterica serovar Enteritidis]|nr:efflux transporter periplasmic adaptor subunit [Salmonella enterica subsp. enterica serovar Enteritidis]